jgi:hypothetical protein
MPKCAGCSGGSTVHTLDTDCIVFSGDGSVGTPLSASPVFNPAGGLGCGVDGLEILLDPDIDNQLSLTVDGLFAPAGGGGGGQVLYFTVGTPGPVAFGGIGATPAALLATADFVGDGVDDSVAIQAAIDASASIVATTSVGVVVIILPGIYVVNTSLRPKGIPLRGQVVEFTTFFTATAFGAPANTRVIDGTISGPSFTNVENIQFQSQTGGAAVIKSQDLHMANCVVLNDSMGADAGFIDVGSITSTISNAFGVFKNNLIAVSGGGTTTDPGLIIRNTLSSKYKISNNSFNADLAFTGSNNDNVYVAENTFTNGSILLNAINLTRFKIRENRITNGSISASLSGGSSFFWTVVDNTVENGGIDIDSLIVSKIRGNTVSATLFGNAIELLNSGELLITGNTVDAAANNGLILDTCNSAVVVGNRIRGYGTGTFDTDDGIRIINSNDCDVQSNSLESSQGQYGINVVSGNNNMVTNNRLVNSGVSASFNDTATGTITTAGNAL